MVINYKTMNPCWNLTPSLDLRFICSKIKSHQIPDVTLERFLYIHSTSVCKWISSIHFEKCENLVQFNSFCALVFFVPVSLKALLGMAFKIISYAFLKCILTLIHVWMAWMLRRFLLLLHFSCMFHGQSGLRDVCVDGNLGKNKHSCSAMKAFYEKKNI